MLSHLHYKISSRSAVYMFTAEATNATMPHSRLYYISTIMTQSHKRTLNFMNLPSQPQQQYTFFNPVTIDLMYTLWCTYNSIDRKRTRKWKQCVYTSALCVWGKIGWIKGTEDLVAIWCCVAPNNTAWNTSPFNMAWTHEKVYSQHAYIQFRNLIRSPKYG